MPDVTQETPPPSGRIKRNTACTSCRDAKVRCNPSQTPSQPCQRCMKLHLTCLVDKTHKRVSRKSKLDELAQEIRSIKQSVSDRSVSSPSQTTEYHERNALESFKEPGPSQLGIPSPASASAGAVVKPGVLNTSNIVAITPSPVLQSPATTLLTKDVAVEPSLPRALGSYPFSGEDIDYYFQKYFEFYHPYMPIVRLRDPNKVYESGPLLFWTIIFIASRRYAKNETVLPFLLDTVRRDIFSVVANFPLPMPSINALILVCSWIFPDVRFVNDPAALFISVAMNASTLFGIHTGKGAHPEYNHGVFENSFTDEEASFTWAGYNIIAQRVSSYMGMPPLGGLFNQTIRNIIDGRTPFQFPSTFRVLLECQKFCNHLSKTTAACLEESRGVSAHTVRLLEDEWNTLSGLICGERADDLDRLNALMVQMEIQTYYMMPLPDYDPEALKRNVFRTYNTAQAVIRETLELDRKTGFVYHIPHFYLRTVISSVCVIYKLLRSSYMKFIDRKAAEQTAADAITISKRATIMEGDLPMRLAGLLESWFEMAQVTQWQEEPVLTFCHRLGASVTMDCLFRWKHDPKYLHSAEASEPPAALTGTETLQNIDWSFMDEFDWNFEPSILTSGT
ncbi:hypothetical protein F4779DRAFT_317499 [Xylariaceae sp. FL0662B]|nr:hypothetical protein F4779DRAFT_317499 [Xylariaceae sp. FL0662B]